MPPTAHIAHRLPYRVRIRVPSRRGDAHYFATLQRAFEQYSGIFAVEANARTAGVVVNLTPESSTEQLIRYAEQHGLFTLDDAPAVTENKASPRHASRIAAHIDLNALLFAGFAAMGLYQVLRGQILAPATTLFWYAYLLKEYHTPDTIKS